jgi:peptidoglycan/LPS O-acetylase OafA/YrhL
MIALIVGALHMYNVIWFPAGILFLILPFILALPAIPRNRVPLVRFFEKLGKRSYGLYLTHIIVIDLALVLILGIDLLSLGSPILLFPLLFVLGLLIPMGIMELAARGPARRVYRYLFG